MLVLAICKRRSKVMLAYHGFSTEAEGAIVAMSREEIVGWDNCIGRLTLEKLDKFERNQLTILGSPSIRWISAKGQSKCETVASLIARMICSFSRRFVYVTLLGKLQR